MRKKGETRYDTQERIKKGINCGRKKKTGILSGCEYCLETSGRELGGNQKIIQRMGFKNWDKTLKRAKFLAVEREIVDNYSRNIGHRNVT